MSPSNRRDFLPGTLDMLVLKTLSVQSMHGYAIARHIEPLSDDVLRIEEGSLYPALQRMRQKGWIKAEWRISDQGRRAKYYALTRRGRAQLEKEVALWRRLSAAVAEVLDAV